MLRLEELGVAYGGRPFVRDVTLALPDREVLAVLGPSGSGKSTLLRAIAGLEPYTGTMTWDDRSLAGVPAHRRGFALMFQDGQLFAHLTGAANVGYPLRLRRRDGTDRAGRSGRQRRAERVEELLALVGLEGYADRLPATLSGGQRQRVALARALAASPALLLLDEPLSALDATLRTRLAADLRAILTGTGTSAILVTHDQDEAFAVADRIALMEEGRIVREGAVAEMGRLERVERWRLH
jgi:thiamine transport system ATP-binding protein